MTTVTAELNPLRAVVSGVAIPVSNGSGTPLRPDIPLGSRWPSGAQNGTGEMPSVDGDTVWGGFMSPHIMTISEVGIVVTAAASGGAWRIGLWAPSPDAPHEPGALIVDAGVVDPTTTGIKTVTVDTALPQGLIFVSVTAVGAAGTAGEAATAVPVLLSFTNIPSELGASACYFTEDMDSAGLPSTAPSLYPSLAAYIFGAPLLIIKHGTVVEG